MHQRKFFWIGLLLILGCALLVFILAPVSGQVATAAIQTHSNTVPLRSNNPGLPAIRPSLSTSSTHRFTLTDVQAYLKTHPFVGGPPAKGVTVSINTIQFMTSKQASTLTHGAQTGLSDAATVCYVKIKGPFALAVPMPPGAKQSPTAAYGVEIFDASTGNMLMWWVPSI